MKRALTLLAVLALVGSTAWASVPDPDYCVVTPMDNMPTPRIIGVPDDAGVSAADLNIYVAAFGGIPIDDAYVEVIFSELCEDLCICDVAIFTGHTDVSGNLTLNGQFGGCCDQYPDAAVVIVAEGVGIRGVSYAVSPDYDGAAGNCATQLPDFIYFGNYYGETTGVVCADYTGDGGCTLPDFITFGAAWGGTCVPE